MHHTRVYHESEMKVGTSPQYDRTVQDKSHLYDRGPSCHIHQVMSCSKHSNTLNLHEHEINKAEHRRYQVCEGQGLRPKETYHCHFCPHFCGQESRSKQNSPRSKPPKCAQHHRGNRGHRGERLYTSAQSLSRSFDSSEEEDRHLSANFNGDKRTCGNERNHRSPKVTHHQSGISGYLYHRAHRHIIPPQAGTHACPTLNDSYTDGCKDNIKSVRFEEDNNIPGYGATQYVCPAHNRGHGIVRQPRSQIRESRTYRWVWGPPLPKTVVSQQHEGVHAGH